MLRSLYSGVSGMRSFQTKMDVIANNIANVNTTGFKSGRANFQDMLSQTTANAQSAQKNAGGNAGAGGVNPQQIGLGVRVGSIDTIMTEGALQPTGRSLDFAIEGNGFFIVSGDGGKTVSYTRDGNFKIDHDGNVVNANGLHLMGVNGKGGTATDLKGLKELKIEPTKGGGKNAAKLDEFTIDGSGKIKALYSDGTLEEIGTIITSNFSNPEGLAKAGNNLYVKTNNSGDPQLSDPGTDGHGFIRQGFLEMSNVDLANEFTEMIVTSRAYQANSRSITTSDEMLQELINLKR